MAVPKDISGPDDPAAAPAPADGRQAADTSTPRGRGPIEDQIAEVPAAYAAHARVLLTSDDARARERAGTAIALAPEEDKPAIPLYLRNLAVVRAGHRLRGQAARSSPSSASRATPAPCPACSGSPSPRRARARWATFASSASSACATSSTA